MDFEPAWAEPKGQGCRGGGSPAGEGPGGGSAGSCSGRSSRLLDGRQRARSRGSMPRPSWPTGPGRIRISTDERCSTTSAPGMYSTWRLRNQAGREKLLGAWRGGLLTRRRSGRISPTSWSCPRWVTPSSRSTASSVSPTAAPRSIPRSPGRRWRAGPSGDSGSLSSPRSPSGAVVPRRATGTTIGYPRWTRRRRSRSI